MGLDQNIYHIPENKLQDFAETCHESLIADGLFASIDVDKYHDTIKKYNAWLEVFKPLNDELDDEFSHTMEKIKSTYKTPQVQRAKINELVDIHNTKLDELKERYPSPLQESLPDHESWYGRKVNAVHQWVEDNALPDGVVGTNCEFVEIDIHALQHTIRDVLNDRDQADELLPTTEGFFFGTTEYDDYYFDDLVELYQWIESRISAINDETDPRWGKNDMFFYHSWW